MTRRTLHPTGKKCELYKCLHYVEFEAFYSHEWLEKNDSLQNVRHAKHVKTFELENLNALNVNFIGSTWYGISEIFLAFLQLYRSTFQLWTPFSHLQFEQNVSEFSFLFFHIFTLSRDGICVIIVCKRLLLYHRERGKNVIVYLQRWIVWFACLLLIWLTGFFFSF